MDQLSISKWLRDNYKKALSLSRRMRDLDEMLLSLSDWVRDERKRVLSLSCKVRDNEGVAERDGQSMV